MRLYLDPWAADMGASLRDDTHASGAAETRVDIDIEVPAASWAPRRPGPGARVAAALFVDGVRRVEARVLLEADREGAGEAGAMTFGALGSFAVGAVRCDLAVPASSFVRPPVVRRVCALAGGRDDVPDVRVPLGSGRGGAGEAGTYRVLAAPESDVDAPVRALQQAMRQAEAALAARLAGADDEVVVCDGPMPFLGGDARVLGYLKTVHDQKLPEASLAVVRALEAGERSPVYLVTGREPERQRFEWYVRLRDPRPWLHSLAGTARLQAHAGADPAATLPTVAALADWSARALPRFATRQHQDPRAPQQLLPVRALEAELRRRMGDPALLRRRITRALAGIGTGSVGDA